MLAVYCFDPETRGRGRAEESRHLAGAPPGFGFAGGISVPAG
jgi:hypothetical protein